MSQVPMSPPPPAPAAPPQRRPLGAGAWTALAVSAVVGLVYTGVLGTLLAVGIGTAFEAAESASTSAPAPDGAEDPFGEDPFGGDPFGEDPGDAADPLRDYPGYEDGDAADVLARPSAEEAVALSEGAVAAVEAAVIGEWESADDEYYERAENVYGGPSLLYDYLSATGYAAADLSTDADKQAVVDRFTAALAPLGFDTVEIADSPSEWSRAGYELDGALGDAEARASLWVVTASSTQRDAPAVELGLVDLDADPSGAVERMLDDVGLVPPAQGAFLAGYANSLLEAGDRDEFTARMEEFGGIATA
ncbi:hypothetical protein [Rathayibacter sp. VKM Ac-2630]|uniref:hypothetical protein n=1 Tax=Rathayibacter sp. VKM Ac-2630 TaxID=1938617 RepID=UPI0009809777|nr:hypothetical protein [Rathayibacter sp. VKM Ac-2630]OOB91564.1 hypothetical protein B0T42_05370 [Rathayibacter sp. VKM Ac-2630]